MASNVEIGSQELVFRFAEVHADAVCHVRFERTLRIPDDNRNHPLPPGLGEFPLDAAGVAAARLPMYQAEAMWISFLGSRYPCAVKVAAGRINALTGESWNETLHPDPQDYLVLPTQPWLDGFCVRKGLIRQFVAMPLGAGYTAEEQITGRADHGGIQLVVYPMRREVYEAFQLKRKRDPAYSSLEHPIVQYNLGLAAGGLMRQEIYEDHFGFAVWDVASAGSCSIEILDSLMWPKLTGRPVPGRPPSAADYTRVGLPWFEYYDERHAAIEGAATLAGLDSVAAKGVRLGAEPLPENAALVSPYVIPVGPA